MSIGSGIAVGICAIAFFGWLSFDSYSNNTRDNTCLNAILVAPETQKQPVLEYCGVRIHQEVESQGGQ